MIVLMWSYHIVQLQSTHYFIQVLSGSWDQLQTQSWLGRYYSNYQSEGRPRVSKDQEVLDWSCSVSRPPGCSLGPAGSESPWWVWRSCNRADWSCWSAWWPPPRWCKHSEPWLLGRKIPSREFNLVYSLASRESARCRTVPSAVWSVVSAFSLILRYWGCCWFGCLFNLVLALWRCSGSRLSCPRKHLSVLETFPYYTYL